MAVVPNTFPPMLTMSRVGMITTQEPQKEMILLRPSPRKISGLRTFHSSATCLWNETELSLRNMLTQKRFLKDLQRKMMLENFITEHFNINYTY